MRVLWMIGASLLFALMGVCVKYVATGFTTAEMICYRGVIGTLFMLGLARAERVSLRTNVPWMHVWRSLIGAVSLACWFYAIANLPLATANALNYMSSVWIAVFVIGGALLTWVPGGNDRRSPIPFRLIGTVMAGFAGVVLLLQLELPQSELFAGVVGLLSGIASAFAYLQLVALAKTGEPETRTVFYFAVGSMLFGVLWMIGSGVSTWTWSAAIWLLPMGLLASMGQWCMTRAYSDTGGHVSTLVVANLQYSGILFSALLGLYLFDDSISSRGWWGIALIIGSGIAATMVRMRVIPSAPGEEH